MRETSRRCFASTLAGTILIGSSGCLRFQSDQSTDGGESNTSQPPDIPVGDVLWENNINARIYHAPVIRNNTLYAVTADNTLYAISLDGQQQWSESPSEAEQSESGPTLGPDGICFGDVAGNVYKYGFDGTQSWYHEADGAISRPPTIHDGAVYVTAESTAVTKINADDGTTRWRTSPSESGFVLSTPEVGGNQIYVGGFDKLRAIKQSTGEFEWVYNSLDPIKPTPTYTADAVYTGTDGNRIYAFNPDDGSEKWSASVSSAVWTSPATTENRVVVGTNDGYVFALSRDDGSEIWRYYAGSPVQADPVINGNTIYVVSKGGKLVTIDATDGSIQWQHTTSSDFEAAPRLTSDGNVLLASFEGRLRLITPP